MLREKAELRRAELEAAERLPLERLREGCPVTIDDDVTVSTLMLRDLKRIHSAPSNECFSRLSGP